VSFSTAGLNLGVRGGRVGKMWQALTIACAAALAALPAGCASVPPLVGGDGTLLGPSITVENPVYIPLGPLSYNQVFEKVIDVVSDQFEIAEYNRYDGRIETFPRVAPGLEQPWKPGCPDLYQRLYATLQSVRHRAVVLIQPADNGGFFIQVTVFKELEDVPRPIRATAGNAIFQTEPTVERQNEVIDLSRFEPNWIPLGRDTCVEQALLQELKRCM
jgi:hypothetical protein